MTKFDLVALKLGYPLGSRFLPLTGAAVALTSLYASPSHSTRPEPRPPWPGADWRALTQSQRASTSAAQRLASATLAWSPSVSWASR